MTCEFQSFWCWPDLGDEAGFWLEAFEWCLLNPTPLILLVLAFFGLVMQVKVWEMNARAPLPKRPWRRIAPMRDEPPRYRDPEWRKR